MKKIVLVLFFLFSFLFIFTVNAENNLVGGTTGYHKYKVIEVNNGISPKYKGNSFGNTGSITITGSITSTGITHTGVCPLAPAIKPPKGCYYKTSINSNGCKINGKLVCTKTGSIIPTHTGVCPLAPAIKPPKGCYYKTSINSNGCKINSKLVCITSSPTCPLNPIKRAPKGCYYVVKHIKGGLGCPVNVLICKNPNPLPLATTSKATNSKTYGLKHSLVLKANIAVSRFASKLDKKYSSSATKISYLNKIILKLESVSQSKPKYKNLINYLVDRLKLQISKYDSGVDSILKLIK